jgi:hypothetical protein
LFCQPALEVDDDLAGRLFRVSPDDTTLDLSPVEMRVALVSSRKGEVCAEVIARIVGTPDLFVATWKNAREPADQAVFSDVALEVLAADERCIARLSIVVRGDTDERLLLDAVIDVNESIVFEGNSFAFQLKVNSGPVDVRHLSERLDFTCTLRSFSPSGSGSERLAVNSRGRTGVKFFLFADVKESIEIFTAIHFRTGRVDIGP